MPRALVRGAQINYDVVGDAGPCFVPTPGGRSGLEVTRPLADKIAGGWLSRAARPAQLRRVGCCDLQRRVRGRDVRR
jgi:hypothetical protein